ncbi:MAG: hypothetical protein R3A45_03865 [Bdellovibrionota bacterium]
MRCKKHHQFSYVFLWMFFILAIVEDGMLSLAYAQSTHKNSNLDTKQLAIIKATIYNQTESALSKKNKTDKDAIKATFDKLSQDLLDVINSPYFTQDLYKQMEAETWPKSDVLTNDYGVENQKIKKTLLSFQA